MKKYLLVMCAVIAVYAGLVFGSSEVRADILITPTRIVFEDRDRFAVVTLVNNGDKTTSYKMNWNFFEMQEEGAAYSRVAQSVTDFDLSKHIVFSPKRVTLASGASQKIRLALRRPDNVPDGDYHAHLGFTTVPDDNDVIGRDSTTSGKPEVAVKIYVGYTIPVVFRSGEVKVDTYIDPISLSRNEISGLLKVAVPIRREGGDYSILGHLMVYHIDMDGNEERVGEVSNAHIFPEVDRRVTEVQLIKDIKEGSLRIVMYDYKYDKNKYDNFIYAERTFPLE